MDSDGDAIKQNEEVKKVLVQLTGTFLLGRQKATNVDGFLFENVFWEDVSGVKTEHYRFLTPQKNLSNHFLSAQGLYFFANNSLKVGMSWT